MSYNNLVPFNFVLSSKHPRAPLTMVLSLPDSSCLPVPPGLFLSRVIESFSAPQPQSLTPTPSISLHKRLVLGSAHPKQRRGYHLNQRVIFLSALHFSDIPEWQTQVYLGHVPRNNPRKQKEGCPFTSTGHNTHLPIPCFCSRRPWGSLPSAQQPQCSGTTSGSCPLGLYRLFSPGSLYIHPRTDHCHLLFPKILSGHNRVSTHNDWFLFLLQGGCDWGSDSTQQGPCLPVMERPISGHGNRAPISTLTTISSHLTSGHLKLFVCFFLNGLLLLACVESWCGPEVIRTCKPVHCEEDWDAWNSDEQEGMRQWESEEP